MRRLLLAFLLMATPAYAEQFPIPHWELAPPTIIQATSVGHDGDLIQFYTWFTHAPDFTTRDQYDRAHESFQFFINADVDAIRPSAHPSFILSGRDLGGLQGDVPLCTTASQKDATTCHGWGDVIGSFSVDWEADELALVLTLPSALLPEAFSYDLMATTYGAAGDEYRGEIDGGFADQTGLMRLVFGNEPVTPQPPPAQIIQPIQTSEMGSWLLVLIGCVLVAVARIKRAA